MTIKCPPGNIRIVSAYCPVHSNGPETVRAQHERILSQNQPTDPREDILDSLHSLIQSWIEQGDHVILCMDVNEDVRSH